MNKILKIIYYRVLWFSIPTYKYYDLLDILLIYLKNVKISSISKTDYKCNIIFLDGSVLTFNNTSKSGWMSEGTMIFSNKKKLTWYDKSPSYEILYRYRKLILKYKKDEDKRKYEQSKTQHEIEKNNLIDCLPIKYLRKQKLKTIKK